MTLNPPDATALVSRTLDLLTPRLLEWYARDARKLPWRRTRDPYAIWISEIMLQQTQVKTVVPYYQAWMRQFPAVADLARAPLTRVLKLWAGLGYYRRARNLHSAARFIRSRLRGRFPDDLPGVLALPGVGRYTAGAICSIAYNQPTPILDGNIMRVFTRLFAIPGDPRAKPVNDHLWHLAECWVKIAASPRIGRSRLCANLNQALMELGALICTPRNPRCSDCPLQPDCQAARTGHPASFPQTPPRPTATALSFTVFVVRHHSDFLVQRQPRNAWNAGLWGFPSLEHGPEPPAPAELFRRCFNSHAAKLEPLGQVRHSITRYRLLLTVYSAAVKSRPRARTNHERWCNPDTLQSLAFSAAHRKILRLARILREQKDFRKAVRKS
jgi:A/G-specific adenine glycosylase